MYVVTRGEAHRAAAVRLGATWVGNEDARPPVPLDCAITFAPSGKVVVDALSSLRKGGVVAINAIHLDQMPATQRVFLRQNGARLVKRNRPSVATMYTGFQPVCSVFSKATLLRPDCVRVCRRRTVCAPAAHTPQRIST